MLPAVTARVFVKKIVSTGECPVHRSMPMPVPRSSTLGTIRQDSRRANAIISSPSVTCPSPSPPLPTHTGLYPSGMGRKCRHSDDPPPTDLARQGSEGFGSSRRIGASAPRDAGGHREAKKAHLDRLRPTQQGRPACPSAGCPPVQPSKTGFPFWLPHGTHATFDITPCCFARRRAGLGNYAVRKDGYCHILSAGEREREGVVDAGGGENILAGPATSCAWALASLTTAAR